MSIIKEFYPNYLKDSISAYEQELKNPSSLWDCYFMELASDVKTAVSEKKISREEGCYLAEHFGLW